MCVEGRGAKGLCFGIAAVPPKAYERYSVRAWVGRLHVNCVLLHGACCMLRAALARCTCIAAWCLTSCSIQDFPAVVDPWKGGLSASCRQCLSKTRSARPIRLWHTQQSRRLAALIKHAAPSPSLRMNRPGPAGRNATRAAHFMKCAPPLRGHPSVLDDEPLDEGSVCAAA